MSEIQEKVFSFEVCRLLGRSLHAREGNQSRKLAELRDAPILPRISWHSIAFRSEIGFCGSCWPAGS